MKPTSGGSSKVVIYFRGMSLHTKTFKGKIDILDTERARGLGVMTSRLQRGGREFESPRAHR